MLSIALEHGGAAGALPFIAAANATFATLADETGATAVAFGFKVVPNGVLVEAGEPIWFAVLDERAAAECSHVGEAADQVGGLAEVPLELGEPLRALFGQQRIEIAGRQPPQVDHLRRWLGIEPGGHSGDYFTPYIAA